MCNCHDGVFKQITETAIVIGSLTNITLQQEIRSSLRILLQTRLMYDVCKYAEKDRTKLHEIMDDTFVAELLSD